ncbi:Intraflagellar transport protein 56 [Frankliniella fusca]|uniref:Intraflagellar transport protein 56 n=1 Tax=Frankliniella fusca TaxID=407009 RepID=A0AAE1L6S2_9NEOP|nr:Intraflagellar transport protein 56 [Frankliniella fusca]
MLFQAPKPILVYQTVFCGTQILSRLKPAVGSKQTGSSSANNQKNLPKLEDFLSARDYTGALTLLEFTQGSGKTDADSERWIGYCSFHLGDYKRAMSIYEKLSIKNDTADDVWVNLACCQFYLGLYPEGVETLKNAKACALKTRLLFHLSHKTGAEEKLLEYHQQLRDITEDQLSLAAIHYLRAHHQEAIDIYKRILLDNRDFLALNVYVALCYYKLDYYDASQEVLSVYLQHYPDSAIATNLKACNDFRLYNGKAAENAIKSLMDQSSSSFIFGNDLIRHNMVVFRSGEGALQVLPPLVDVIPEARLNLVIYYLKQDEVREAYQLIKDLEPAVPAEYNLKGVVNASMGQETGSREHIKFAQQYFELVGSSDSECDTIPGRQCMASCYFLMRQFSEVLLYLTSIKSYFYTDDTFNFNYAQAKCAVGNFKEAEEAFLLIQNEKIRNMMNGKPQMAWEIYLRLETSAESFNLLQLIANDCYRLGHFWFSAKAFDMLERLDPSPEHWEGKRGACVGAFQMVIAGRQPKELLTDVISLLRNTANSQVETIIRTMKRWAKENRINV